MAATRKKMLEIAKKQGAINFGRYRERPCEERREIMRAVWRRPGRREKQQKLTTDEASTVLLLLGLGSRYWTKPRIARIFKVSVGTVYNLLTGRNYKELKR
jgi:hypothetical protein